MRFVPQIPIRLLFCKRVDPWKCRGSCRRPQFYRHGIQAKNVETRLPMSCLGMPIPGAVCRKPSPRVGRITQATAKTPKYIRVLQEQCDTAKVFLSVIVIMKNTGSHLCSHLAMGSAILNFPYRMSQRVQMTVMLWCLSTSRISGTATDRRLFNSICQIMVQPLI